MTDALGQVKSYSYAKDDLLTAIAYTNALHTTPNVSFAYAPYFPRLVSMADGTGTKQYTYVPIGANNVTAASFTYDAFARVRTFTDSEGWTVIYDYDAADRVTKVTYPDGTFETYSYDRLDLASYQDRQYRVWTYSHDANRRLTAVVDPGGQQTQLGYDIDPRDWGEYRVPAHPNEGTNTLGRSGFFIHGGKTPGSAGCIDVGDADKEFFPRLKNAKGPVPLEVK